MYAKIWQDIVSIFSSNLKDKETDFHLKKFGQKLKFPKLWNRVEFYNLIWPNWITEFITQELWELKFAFSTMYVDHFLIIFSVPITNDH